MSSVDVGSTTLPLPPAVHPLAILYGSETGTAQEVAEYAAGMARRRGFDAWAAPLDSLPISSVLEISLALFVVSTTGDGEIPRNMSISWRFLLRRSLPSNALQGLRFGVFGLGDSTYDKYNAAGRKLHTRLLQLGAIELVPLGLGDDQSPKGMWGDLDPWISRLWRALLELKPLPQGTAVDDTPRLHPPSFILEPIPTGAHQGFTPRTSARTSPADISLEERMEQEMARFWGCMAPPSAPATGHCGGAPAIAVLRVNRRLTATDHFQDVRHLELDVRGVPGGGDYRAGEVVWLHPSNDATAVESFAVMLGIRLDEIVRISHLSRSKGEQEAVRPAHSTLVQEAVVGSRDVFPAVCSMRHLLTNVLDILGTPRRSFFERLALFASHPDERDKLIELGSPEGADLLSEYATREKRTYVEVFQDFPSCQLPPERLLELIPPLRPRGFSIASSALETPSTVHLCVAVVSFRTPYKRIRQGVCSSWLASLESGARVPLSIRPGTFRLPESSFQPVIMVGPGTGIAPMRSVILERRRQRRAKGLDKIAEGGGVSKSIEGDLSKGQQSERGCSDTLFFGCRYREKDFLYGEEWTSMDASGELSLHTAFSRQNPDPKGRRIYVQRRIREQAAAISNLIVNQRACVLVSGSAKQMPRDVREAFRDALATHQQVGSKAEAEAVLKTMDRQRRYIVEAWS